MSLLDVAKEQIAYLKPRLGVVRNFSMKVRHSPYVVAAQCVPSVTR